MNPGQEKMMMMTMLMMTMITQKKEKEEKKNSCSGRKMDFDDLSNLILFREKEGKPEGAATFSPSAFSRTRRTSLVR